jgi:hypothetical protein
MPFSGIFLETSHFLWEVTANPFYSCSPCNTPVTGGAETSSLSGPSVTPLNRGYGFQFSALADILALFENAPDHAPAAHPANRQNFRLIKLGDHANTLIRVTQNRQIGPRAGQGSRAHARLGARGAARGQHDESDDSTESGRVRQFSIDRVSHRLLHNAQFAPTRLRCGSIGLAP